MPSVRLTTHLSHPHFLLFFCTVIFSLDPIFKFLQALPLGCDCAFHSGREHQDLLPPEGRIVSDTYISQKSQTSEILYMYVICHRLMSRSIVIFCHTKVGKLRASGRGASPPQGGSPVALFLFFFLFSHFEVWSSGQILNFMHGPLPSMMRLKHRKFKYSIHPLISKFD